jgi:hypothetical protein
MVLRILIVIRHVSEVAGYDLDDVGGDLAGPSTGLAEAVKSQVLLRLAE